MTRGLSRRWARGAIWLGTGLVLVACASQDAAAPQEQTGQVSSAVFTNGGFELGAPGQPPQGWTVQTFLNNTGVTVQSPQTYAGLNLSTGGNALTTTINAVPPLSQPDPDLGLGASFRWPRYGAQCARVNFHSSNQYGNGRNVNALSQTMTISAGDVDPSDGQVHIRFVIAPVLQNPGHPPPQQPYYFVQLTNLTQNTILYTDFNLSAQPGVPWKTVNGGTAQEIDYVDWSLVDIAPGSAKLAMNDMVQLQIIGGGCQPGAHFGEVYVDGVGTTIPGLFVSGTGPAQANAGTNITYNLSYKNGSSAAETQVVIDFTTPPGTTFQSITPPAGAICTTPAAGASGTITCTFAGPVAAGAAGSFTITVNINPSATGTITAGTYDIHSVQETPLNGNKITTLIGCSKDADCSAGNWCNETGNACTPTLANGTPVPNDPPHTNPTLNGTCTGPAGTLVCASGVCDTADNRCGYLNNDGPCSALNGGTVCRSGVCDPDLKCGYAVGDGPCTPANGGTVCRSGACSVNNTCEPAGGCNIDADCTGGNWCNETTHTCTAKLPNGAPIPNDPPHTAPALNGTCTLPAGLLVCASGVCDTDNRCGLANNDGPCTVANGGIVCRSGVCDPDLKCGYAVGDGPCTPANAGTVCRSGACSVNNTCEPAGGCDVDADCTGGNWCNEGTHTCTAKLPNGTPIPNDPPHTNPTLNATCTAPAATLVCASGVCDADNKCGLANGDGPCTVGNGGTVCRSGVCDPDLKCGYAVGDGPCTPANAGTVCRSGACSANNTCEPAGGCDVDADCTGGKWCNEGTHTCTAKLPNGSPMPNDPPHTNPTLNATCTAAAATLVCASGVCDTDNKCGYANGDGPCTSGNGGVVCRSTICATSGSNSGLCEACNVSSDCPNGQVCSPTNTCITKVPDAGTDSGVADAGHDGSLADASVSADAATGADAAADAASSNQASDTGTLEGGGCSCKTAGTGGSGAPGGVLGAASILGVLAARRRRERRETR